MMRGDVECPFCGHENYICHDDGYGYEEDERHEQQCSKCEAEFEFETIICMYYDAYKPGTDEEWEGE